MGRGGLGGLPIPLPTGKGGIGALILTVAVLFLLSRCGVPGVGGGGSGGAGGFDISDVFNQFPSAAPASGEDLIESGPDPDDEHDQPRQELVVLPVLRGLEIERLLAQTRASLRWSSLTAPASNIF